MKLGLDFFKFGRNLELTIAKKDGGMSILP